MAACESSSTRSHVNQVRGVIEVIIAILGVGIRNHLSADSQELLSRTGVDPSAGRRLGAPALVIYPGRKGAIETFLEVADSRI